MAASVASTNAAPAIHVVSSRCSVSYPTASRMSS
jgi:hypothetical protein